MVFIPEQVEPMLTCINGGIGQQVYDEVVVASWVDLICDKSMETLTKLNALQIYWRVT